VKFTPEEQDAFDFLDFEDASPSHAPSIGEEVAGFLLLREIGAGGGGVVYEAMQSDLDRRVALKLIPLQSSDLVPDGEERIRREARLLAELRHPNIVEIFDSGIIAGYRWVAMHLITGPSLDKILQGRVQGFPEPQGRDWLPFVVPILQKVGSALSAAHARNIVHRDIKPSNILLDTAGEPYLVDFGLARRGVDAEQDQTIGFLGTPRYASPEQLDHGILTSASDVYSLGCIAWEAFHGQVPFPNAGTVEGARAVKVQIPVWKDRKKVPRDLRAVIEKCLEKKAGNRYPHGGSVASDIGRFLRFEAVHAIPRGPLSRLVQRIRLQPRKAMGSASLVLLVAALIWISLYAKRQGASSTLLRARALVHQASEIFESEDWGEFINFVDFHDLALPENIEVCQLAADGFFNKGTFDRSTRYYSYLLENGDLSLANRLGKSFSEWKLGNTQKFPVELQETAIDFRDIHVKMLCFQHTRDMEGAVVLAARALEQNPTSIMVLASKARYEILLGRSSSAIIDLKTYLALRPGSALKIMQLVRELNRLKRYHEALEIAMDTLREDPTLIKLRMALCTTLVELERFDEAFRQSDICLAMADEVTLSAAKVARARVLFRSGREAEGRRLLDLVLEEKPDSYGAMQLLSRFLLEHGEYEESAILAEQLMQSPKYAWRRHGRIGISEIYFRQERYEEALDILGTESPGSMGLRLKAKILNQQGLYEETDTVYLDALLQEPDDVGVRNAYLAFLLEQKRQDDAFDQALLIYGIDSESPEGAYWVGFTQLERGDARAGLRYAHQANVGRPNWPKGLNLEGDCLIALGRGAEGLALKEHADEIVDQKD